MLKQALILLSLFTSLLYSKPMNPIFEHTNLSQWSTLGKWEMQKEKNHNIVSLIHKSNASFNLCYNKKLDFLNGSISVKFRANSGHIDQGGGLMWRVQDNDNYYVARFNPLEDNFRFYIVHDGIRSELASANVTLAKGWHTMKIEQKGDMFKGYLDGKLYLEHKDNHLHKIGSVGVWTKADALSSFDDLQIETSK